MHASIQPASWEILAVVWQTPYVHCFRKVCIKEIVVCFGQFKSCHLLILIPSQTFFFFSPWRAKQEFLSCTHFNQLPLALPSCLTLFHLYDLQQLCVLVKGWCNYNASVKQDVSRDSLDNEEQLTVHGLIANHLDWQQLQMRLQYAVHEIKTHKLQRFKKIKSCRLKYRFLPLKRAIILFRYCLQHQIQ